MTKITFDDYREAMRIIIEFKSMSEKKIAALDSDGINNLQAKVDKAYAIKGKYDYQKEYEAS